MKLGDGEENVAEKNTWRDKKYMSSQISIPSENIVKNIKLRYFQTNGGKIQNKQTISRENAKGI